MNLPDIKSDQVDDTVFKNDIYIGGSKCIGETPQCFAWIPVPVNRLVEFAEVQDNFFLPDSMYYGSY